MKWKHSVKPHSWNRKAVAALQLPTTSWEVQVTLFLVHLCLEATGPLSPLASSCMGTLSYQTSLQVLANWHRRVNCHVLARPTDPAVPRENCPGHPSQGVPNQVGSLSIQVTLSSPLLSSLSTQKPFFPIPCVLVLPPLGLGEKKLWPGSSTQEVCASAWENGSR